MLLADEMITHFIHWTNTLQITNYIRSMLNQNYPASAQQQCTLWKILFTHTLQNDPYPPTQPTPVRNHLYITIYLMEMHD